MLNLTQVPQSSSFRLDGCWHDAAGVCVQVAAKAIGTMPSIMFFPLFTFTIFLAVFIYWVIVFSYQWSAGTVVPLVDEERDAAEQYTLSWMYRADAANSTLPPDSELTAVEGDADVAGVACYDDPNCYYSVDFSKEQQARLGVSQRTPVLLV